MRHETCITCRAAQSGELSPGTPSQTTEHLEARSIQP